MNDKHSKNKPLRLYGLHAVKAALDNPQRIKRQLYATTSGFEKLKCAWSSAKTPLKQLPIQRLTTRELASFIGRDTVHQGLVLEVEPLVQPILEAVLTEVSDKPILVLDHVTDPQNLGAILRSCAAFEVMALVSQERHTPEESGALAKAASGALELVPWVRVVNVARALDHIAQAGFWRVGLVGSAVTLLDKIVDDSRLCLVMGAEGTGLRPNVAHHCDQHARIAISQRMDSLNVATASAVALYIATSATKR